MSNTNQFDRIDLPISFGVKNELLHTKINGEWVPLGTSGKEIEKLYNAEFGAIPPHKRDIAISKEEIQGQEAPYKVPYNYVSVFDRYIGWYKDNDTARLHDPILSRNRFHSFSVGRIIDGAPMEQLTKEDITKAISAKGDPVFWNMGHEFTESSLHYKYNVKDKEYISKTDIATRKNVFQGMVHYPILATDLFSLYNHTHVTEGENKFIHRDLVMLRIDWNTVPKDAYFRYSICTEFGYLVNATTSINIKVFKLNYDGKNVKFDSFGQHPDSIKTVTLHSKNNTISYTDDYHYLDSDGDPHQNFIKLERPEERYTILALEIHYSGVIESGSNVRNGIFINMFVPEEQFYNTCRGYNENHFLYIKDFSKIGKIWNMNNYSLIDYAMLPTFPKLGDRLTVLEGADVVGKNIAPKYEEYICLGPILAERGINPSSGYLYKSGRYANTYPKKINLEILESDNTEIVEYGPWEYYKQWFKVSSSTTSSSSNNEVPDTIPFKFEYDPTAFELEITEDLEANPLTVKEFTELKPLQVLNKFNTKEGNVIEGVDLYAKCKGTEDWVLIHHAISSILKYYTSLTFPISEKNVRELLINNSYYAVNTHSPSYTAYKLKVITDKQKYNLGNIPHIKYDGNYAMTDTILRTPTSVFSSNDGYNTINTILFKHSNPLLNSEDILNNKDSFKLNTPNYSPSDSDDSNLLPNNANKVIVVKHNRGIFSTIDTIPNEYARQYIDSYTTSHKAMFIEYPSQGTEIPWNILVISKNIFDKYYASKDKKEAMLSILLGTVFNPWNAHRSVVSIHVIDMSNPDESLYDNANIYSTAGYRDDDSRVNFSATRILEYDNVDLYMFAFAPQGNYKPINHINYTDDEGAKSVDMQSLNYIEELNLVTSDFILVKCDDYNKSFDVEFSGT